MRQFYVLFSGSDASYLMRWSVGCITNTSESNFSVHTADGPTPPIVAKRVRDYANSAFAGLFHKN
jgi:hypothetical protein